MKTICLCEKPYNIERVFGVREPVFGKADVLREPERFRDTEYIFSSWGIPILTEEEIQACFPRLRAVFYGAGSVQHFARPYLNRGVKVFSAWMANAVPVAEYTVAQIILANKGFFTNHHIRSEAEYLAGRKHFAAYPGNYGAKVGLIGVGTIGKLVARRLQGYALEVLAFDPFLSDSAAEELGVKKVDLATVFAQCQVVSNHLANNEQTKGMLNGALFESMLPCATFLNTGRGAQVVEEDLARVLQARPDLTAVLDVTVEEPPVDGCRLYALENCILTPHIAGSSGNEVRRMGEYMRQEYENFVQGRPCRYEVTQEMLKTMA